MFDHYYALVAAADVATVLGIVHADDCILEIDGKYYHWHIEIVIVIVIADVEIEIEVVEVQPGCLHVLSVNPLLDFRALMDLYFLLLLHSYCFYSLARVHSLTLIPHYSSFI